MLAFDEADIPVVIDLEGMVVRMQEVGGMTLAFWRLPAGADLHALHRGLPGDRCPSPHWAYLISGRLRVHAADGAHVVDPGQAFYVEPGHVPEALEDTVIFQVSPTAPMRDLCTHMQGRIELEQAVTD